MRFKKIKTVLAVLMIFLGAANLLAQNDTSQSKVWVTISDTDNIPEFSKDLWVGGDPRLNSVFKSYTVQNCVPALPASRNETLQKVFEITFSGTLEDFTRDLASIEFCSNIVPAPQYELLSVDPFPDDYSLAFSNDYALDLIDAEKAWEYSTGDSNTIIGISDGGFYLNHEELQGSYVSAQNSVFATPPQYMHGTAVSVTAAGNTNNGVGKSAIGYNCRMALKPMGYNHLLELCYAGVRIINVSWSSGCNYVGYYDMVIQELFENGCIIVASAGNGNICGGVNSLIYPAALEGVISVTSVGPWDNHERIVGNPNSTHQHNAKVDICAPGYDISGTNYPGNYLIGSGSSFAAPYVTGTIGLMLSLRPCLSREEIIEILSITAVDVYAVNPADYYGLLGAGRLDAGAALEYVANYECVSPPLTADGTVGVISMNNPKPTGGQPTKTHDGDGYLNENATGRIEKSDFGIDIRVFPNPTKGTCFISWKEFDPQQIRITDAAGSLVQEIPCSEDINKLEVIVKETGVYFVQVLNIEGVVATKKLLVY